MEGYWIVRRDGIVVAALAEKFYADRPSELVESLKEFAESGPIERIVTEKRVQLGATFAP